MSNFGKIINSNTIQFERVLPGTIDLVWSYLTESEKRAKWFAGVEMGNKVGDKVKHDFDHSRLNVHNEAVPEQYKEKGCGTMESTITQLKPKTKLGFTWSANDASEVVFELEPQGADKVLLRVTHSKLPTKEEFLGVSAGWHSHLDILEAVLKNETIPPFWSTHERLKAEYNKKIA